MHEPIRLTSRRPWLAVLVIAAAAAVAALPGLAGQSAAQAAPPDQISFQLYPAAKFLPCMAVLPSITPTVDVTVTRGQQNDQMTLTLSGFKTGLQFDLFTVQRSNQNADGSPVAGFTNFGLAWYQSDVQIPQFSRSHVGSVTINTILLDQIFGFDPDAALSPTNTFHVGMWFNNPDDAAACGFDTSHPTPFNGEHHAGPLAFISRPDATTGLGPLCTDPNTSNSPATCNP